MESARAHEGAKWHWQVDLAGASVSICAERLVDRPKKGFGVPIAEWLRGPLKEWAADLLSPAALRQTEIFKPELVLEKWKQHQAGTVDWDKHLWDILNMQAWAIANK